MKKFYKIYEILDNVEEELECYPEYFVGAFLSEESAKELCKYIDISDCNSTKIEYAEITEQDIKDIEEFGLQGFDEEGLKEISKLLKEYKKNNKQNNEELIK